MKKAFVVGHPVKHSRSPLIHRYWLEQYGLEGSYERIDVAPADFPSFLRSIPDSGYAGGNVTIPHKEVAFAGVARRTERAERLRAVNTVWIHDGELWGDNTDILGFAAHLDQTLGSAWQETVDCALVIGAGGAARAVAASLVGRVERILLTNRTQSKAEDMITDLSRNGQGIVMLSWEAMDRFLPECQLVVNTTSLGMVGQPPLMLDLSGIPDHAIVADVVYIPLKTRLLAEAEARGLRVVDGLGMLLHQAVPAFARWFGVTPRVTPELRALITADLEASR